MSLVRKGLFSSFATTGPVRSGVFFGTAAWLLVIAVIMMVGAAWSA